MSLQFVSNQLDVRDDGDLVEDVLYVLLVHPRLNIANPKRLGADLTRLLAAHSVLLCHFLFCLFKIYLNLIIS